MFEESVFSAVASFGVFGILVLSCGVGVGEEVLFCGFFMLWVDVWLEGFGVGVDVVVMGLLVSISLVFGALYVITS